MSFLFKALLILLAFNVAWVAWAIVVSRRLSKPRRWRAFAAGFVGMQVVLLGWVLASRMYPEITPAMPVALRAAAYIWHLVIAPGAVALATAAMVVLGVMAGVAQWRRPGGSVAGGNPSVDMGRRRVLAAAIAAPPALTALALGKSMWELDSLRVREITAPIAGLHPSLDGVTIAHVTDTHVGRYTTGAALRTISDTVNRLRCDLIAFTGDLIDGAHTDLPEALEMLGRLEAPTYLCEGNHDLFEGRDNFERIVRAGGANLLTDESAVVSVRGAPVQVLGIRWRGRGDGGAAFHTEAVARLRLAEAFPILLAHHPHAFDTAATLDLPLTLAGHTHGGQLMLNEGVGAGPALFRYWSGRYTQRMASGATAHCVVSNGAGNWFPLRMNAPAEIVRVTLRRA